MKTIALAFAVSCAAIVSGHAAEGAAYAILRLRSVPEQVVLTRFPNLQTCSRELAGIKALLATDVRRSGARRSDIVPPEALPGYVFVPPEIDGECRLATKR